MGEAMVTARMSRAKKESAHLVLEQLGTNASRTINDLYDYILLHRSLPFGEASHKSLHSQEDVARAVQLIDSIAVLDGGNPYASMTDEEIKLARLSSRGLLDGWSE